MGTIAKGEITLSPVNDAYSVLLTPASCIINADYDGSNPKLQNALTTLVIKRGTKTVPFYILSIAKSSGDIGVSFSTQQTTSATLKLLAISRNELGGWVDITFKTADGFDYTSTIRFNFTVVRETSMLDWILDWEGSKTKVGGTYIMTPKLFVGHKESVVHAVEHEGPDSYTETYEWIEDALTGVYIGPDLLGANQTVGLYGYHLSKEIFHLNAEGGMIGGWDINEAGIASGNLKILSEGTIIAGTSTQTYWSLKADGNASFANGNVTFKPNGDAHFNGEIIAQKGYVAGWRIDEDYIISKGVVLDSDTMLIGLVNQRNYTYTDGKKFIQDVAQKGGVYMLYSDTNEYGLFGYALNQQCVFRLGSTNQIASWNFDHQAIYTGVKNTTQHAFTEEGGLTISPSGVRSNKWYIDSDGTAQFVAGSVKFNGDNAEMFGWSMKGDRFSTKHAALVSNSLDSGIYVSVADISNIASSSLRNTISNNGGIYMYSDSANAILRAYDTNGKLGFRLSTNGHHQIGNWSFNHESIYTGSTNLSPEGFTVTPGSLILSTSGLIGFLWKLNADGSGALAGGNIAWDSIGNVTFSSNVKLSWSSITNGPNLTKIDANGIYTGTISADNITAGIITSAAIQNGDHWALKQDGSGYLANKYISWTATGALTVKNAIMNNVRINGTIRQPWSRSGIYMTLGGDESLTFDNIVAGTTGGWGDGSAATMLTWTLKDSGRIVRLANWKWDGETFDADITITAPDGKYFFEDGVAKKKLVFSREIVELIGYADSSTFYGWVVVNRVNFSTRARYGRQLRCLAMGTVTENGTTAPTVKCCTFDGTTISVSKLTDKNNDGIYKVSLPAEWNLEPDGYQVMLTGLGEGLMKATLASRTATECVIHVSDDASRNNGSFQFQIFNTNDWIG